MGGVAFTDPCADKEEVWVSVSSVLHLFGAKGGKKEKKKDRLLLDANVQSCHERWTVQREHLNNPYKR